MDYLIISDFGKIQAGGRYSRSMEMDVSVGPGGEFIRRKCAACGLHWTVSDELTIGASQ